MCKGSTATPPGDHIVQRWLLRTRAWGHGDGDGQERGWVDRQGSPCPPARIWHGKSSWERGSGSAGGCAGGGQSRLGQGYGLGDAENPSWRGAGCGAGALGTGSHPSSPALLALQNWAQGGRPDVVAIPTLWPSLPCISRARFGVWGLLFSSGPWLGLSRDVPGRYRRHGLVSVCCVCRLAGAGRGALSCVVGTPEGP